jgi:hypothetical protein
MLQATKLGRIKEIKSQSMKKKKQKEKKDKSRRRAKSSMGKPSLTSVVDFMTLTG